MQIQPLYTVPPVMDGNQSYPTPGSTTSLPTSGPGMYSLNHNTKTDIPA